jgi:outer membrane biogenesis lipoprotein LolB
MDVMTMKRLRLALCGLVVLALTACGGEAASGTPASPPTSTTSRPAPATSAATTGSTAAAKATLGVDGLLFVGADTAKVGNTIKVTVTNQTSGQLDVKLLDPVGQTAAQIQVASKASADISAVATAAGSWKLTFAGAAIGTGLNQVITVK